jgi:hypothetical protein
MPNNCNTGYAIDFTGAVLTEGLSDNKHGQLSVVGASPEGLCDKCHQDGCPKAQVAPLQKCHNFINIGGGLRKSSW